jgi:hypothetical protein
MPVLTWARHEAAEVRHVGWRGAAMAARRMFPVRADEVIE